MSNEIATYTGGSLAIHADQGTITASQLKALNLGEHVTEGDLARFLHRSQQLGLDPFSGEIHMIERKQRGRNGAPDTYSQTIQIGIDGFRKTGHRVARESGESLSVDAPLWAGRDGVWRELWLGQEPPTACKVTVWRGGSSFTSVCMFDEYVQLGGSRERPFPIGQWGKMPANQLAKCTEAASWRKACPAELGTIYVPEEMDQADNTRQRVPARSRASSATVTLESVQAKPAPEPEPTVDPKREMVAALDLVFPDLPGNSPNGIEARMQLISEVLGREIGHTNELGPDDMRKIVAAAHEITEPQPEN